jgi:hypothetical protein
MFEAFLGYMKEQEGVVFETMLTHAERWKAANPVDRWRQENPARVGTGAITEI